jgi:hypothetical protein
MHLIFFQYYESYFTVYTRYNSKTLFQSYYLGAVTKPSKISPVWQLICPRLIFEQKVEQIKKDYT